MTLWGVMASRASSAEYSDAGASTKRMWREGEKGSQTFLPGSTVQVASSDPTLRRPP